MLTLFTGMPGAGKTAALVDLLRGIAGTRPIYSDGLNGLKLEHTPVDATKWHEEVPDGAVLVIDEVQRVWRPRGPGSKVPEAVQMLETHRHRGIDIFVTTQNPRLVDANVRGLVGRHVHIRDTGWLGRQWYEWPECNESMAWKTCPNKRKYKLPKAAFSLYTSASEHTKPIRNTPIALYLAIGAIGAAVVGGVMVVRTVGGKSAPAEAKPATPAAQNLVTAPGASSSPAGGAHAGPKVIDDRVDWIPRVSSRPESAPAYDEIRKVSAMPVVVGCMVFKGRTRCYTSQGTDAGLDEREAAQWMQSPRFDPYAREGSREARGQGVGGKTPESPHSGPQVVLIEGPGFRDPLRQQVSSVVGRGDK